MIRLDKNARRILEDAFKRGELPLASQLMALPPDARATVSALLILIPELELADERKQLTVSTQDAIKQVVSDQMPWRQNKEIVRLMKVHGLRRSRGRGSHVKQFIITPAWLPRDVRKLIEQAQDQEALPTPDAAKAQLQKSVGLHQRATEIVQMALDEQGPELLHHIVATGNEVLKTAPDG
jgi:hypothetical protein